MENYKLVDKLKNEANISFEEAKYALEQANWDILDAFVYLEQIGKIKKPSISTFYTNENKESHKKSETINYEEKKNKYNNEKKGNTSEGIFETVCKIIDTGNNILFEVKRESITVLRLPITVIILLLIFGFYIVIPLFIVSLFFDIEFALSGKWRELNNINKGLKLLSVNIKKVKEMFKKGNGNG
ncbi:ubiquitin [Clostridium sp. SHJSY1]|uniref:ubiquitin n=1 Tax=Clostridium sp. SHJSY1 TaxID=2942483 RepID=UPI002873FE96|nr:ubiquitin [Clostridium sp. SHJSY1]MDS0524718.1 ubiquitin [Clostridium sp. SHJSY1]